MRSLTFHEEYIGGFEFEAIVRLQVEEHDMTDLGTDFDKLVSSPYLESEFRLCFVHIHRDISVFPHH